jgi:hypothetical protein
LLLAQGTLAILLTQQLLGGVIHGLRHGRRHGDTQADEEPWPPA